MQAREPAPGGGSQWLTWWPLGAGGRPSIYQSDPTSFLPCSLPRSSNPSNPSTQSVFTMDLLNNLAGQVGGNQNNNQQQQQQGGQQQGQSGGCEWSCAGRKRCLSRHTDNATVNLGSTLQGLTGGGNMEDKLNSMGGGGAQGEADEDFLDKGECSGLGGYTKAVFHHTHVRCLGAVAISHRFNEPSPHASAKRRRQDKHSSMCSLCSPPRCCDRVT